MKKNSVLRRIIPFVLMIAMMFTFACDKDSGGTENDTGNVQAAKTSGPVPRADAMTLINSISSGEKMYKFCTLIRIRHLMVSEVTEPVCSERHMIAA